MRTFSKMLTALCLVFIAFACQDGSVDVLSNANKHNNARTNADFYASGTMTVPAGTYETIVIAANSNITLANDVKFNNFDYEGVNITITIPVSAIATHYYDVWIPTGVTLTIYGTLNSKMDFLIGGATVNNVGTHNIGGSLILDNYNATYNESLLASFKASRIWVRWPDTKFVFNGTNQFIMPSITVTTLEINPQVSGTTGIFFGKGKIVTGGGTVKYVPLTASSTIKVCTSTPLNFSNGGSFGVGYYGC